LFRENGINNKGQAGRNQEAEIAAGGYGSQGATQRFDPDSATWSVHEPETVITPPIEYPVDGCYGLNDVDDEIIVLFPDTLVTDSLHIFNIDSRSWYTEPVPGFYPEEGRWGQDIVSLYSHTGENVCYLSGGALRPGGGQTRDLWEYHPDTNNGLYVGPWYSPTVPFTRVFNFHASWYVPWIGTGGGICVGGGADHNHQIMTSTQCFDLDSRTFNPANSDLGPLPEPWWGMADGWAIRNGQYEIWIANGVAQDGTLLPYSAYASETSGGFQYGPKMAVALYRGEGDGFFDTFYTVGGSAGGFWYIKHNQFLEQCPECHNIYLPLTLREY